MTETMRVNDPAYERDQEVLARASQDDPYVMHLIVRHDAPTSLGVLAQKVFSLTVRASETFKADPALTADWDAWERRSYRKVCLRAKDKGNEWGKLLDQCADRVVVDDDERLAVVAPMVRSARPAILTRLQVCRWAFEDLPDSVACDDVRSLAARVVVNGTLEMSVGKTLAQLSHAAMIATDSFTRVDDQLAERTRIWTQNDAPIRLSVATTVREFERAAVGRHITVRDGGLTEIAPGSQTVLVCEPGR